MHNDNPLLPVVKELAEEVIRLRSGRLFAKSSTEGPRSIEDLRLLLLAAGAPAAWWLIERALEAEGAEEDDETEYSVAEGEGSEGPTEEDTRIEDIKEALLKSEPVWKMLKAVQHILYGDDIPTPKPPAIDPNRAYGIAWRARDDDDIPF